jgi:hypothetical protein
MGAVKIPPTTDDELRRAIEAGRRRRVSERRATRVQYDPYRDAIEIELTDGLASGCREPWWRNSVIEAAGFIGWLRHQA